MEVKGDKNEIYYKDSSDDEDSSYEDDDELQGLNFDGKKENESSKKYEAPYVVLDADQILGRFYVMKDHVSSLTGLPMGVCAIISAKFQWNNQKLYDAFDKCSTPQEFLSDNKILQLGSKNEKKGACNICFEEDVKLVSFFCSHPFCSNCWKRNLESEINAKEWRIKCMDGECDYLLSEDLVEFLLSDNDLFKNYQTLAAESFVQVNDLVKFCPGANCGRIISANFPECYGVKCTCDESFCMKCDIGNHDPITCTLLENWTKKSGEENENLKWLQKNTKPCPNCKKAIEKNGGCNHMTCRSGCNHEFCWLCLKDWRGHRACNQFESPQDFKNADLEAFTHYNNRYMDHSKSLKLERNLKEIVDRKTQELQDVYEFTKAEIKFLKKAVVTLFECRRVVMYSYPFAFFIKESNQKHIFEENQSRLESGVERLSGFLENEFECGNTKIKQWKQAVIDVSKNVDKQRTNLLEHVMENNRKNQWEYKKGV